MRRTSLRAMVSPKDAGSQSPFALRAPRPVRMAASGKALSNFTTSSGARPAAGARASASASTPVSPMIIALPMSLWVHGARTSVPISTSSPVICFSAGASRSTSAGAPALSMRPRACPAVPFPTTRWSPSRGMVFAAPAPRDENESAHAHCTGALLAYQPSSFEATAASTFARFSFIVGVSVPSSMVQGPGITTIIWSCS